MTRSRQYVFPLPPDTWWDRVVRQKRLLITIGIVGVALLTFLARKGLLPGGTSPFDIAADYLGTGPHHHRTAVVFVHGLTGNKTETWANRAASFPTMLAADPEFHDSVDVFLFEYYTPMFRTAASIPALADQLRGSLDDHRVFDDHQRVVFLSHSMGGVIVRQYLLNNRQRLPKVPMLYFYATPTNGAELSGLARKVSDNPQLRGIVPVDDNDFLQGISSGWLNSSEARMLSSFCAYETLPTYGFMIVSQASATALCNQPLDPLTANHIDIVKPKDRADPRYSRFAHALRDALSGKPMEAAGPQSGPTPPKKAAERNTRTQDSSAASERSSAPNESPRDELIDRIAQTRRALDNLDKIMWREDAQNPGEVACASGPAMILSALDHLDILAGRAGAFQSANFLAVIGATERSTRTSLRALTDAYTVLQAQRSEISRFEGSGQVIRCADLNGRLHRLQHQLALLRVP